MDFWQTILATLIGGSISLVAVTLTNKHQWRVESSRKRLEKIEQAHVLTIKIGDLYRRMCGEHLASLVLRESKPVDALGEKVPFEELKMLVDFYAPELSWRYEEVLQATQKDYGKIHVQMISINKLSDEERSQLKSSIMDRQSDIEEKVKQLQDGLVDMGRRYV
ncbi:MULTISPECIES: hypothetical protein [unclassified Thioalkalivibrio]|uniref:hypothetical protein n=1 Tax=unclassified Thioalkalivibrio TaxID=2621013 RepID=UPI00035ED66A|nr:MULTISPECIES: hypothetical protein [unclassified Thioalkalivibrio]